MKLIILETNQFKSQTDFLLFHTNLEKLHSLSYLSSNVRSMFSSEAIKSPKYIVQYKLFYFLWTSYVIFKYLFQTVGSGSIHMNQIRFNETLLEFYEHSFSMPCCEIIKESISLWEISGFFFLGGCNFDMVSLINSEGGGEGMMLCFQEQK